MMARPLRIQYPGAFYHVTSRGNERKDVFRSIADREKFLGYLESASARYGAVIHAYCLMSNHYHLLLETPAANLSEIMRHINGAYTTYFNVKRKRAGHLFQGRFKAILVEAQAYALELSRYLHLNPVRAGLVKLPQDYPWSSYAAYIGLVPPALWLKTGLVLSLLTENQRIAPLRYREFAQSAANDEIENPLGATVAAGILGGEPFVQEVLKTYVDPGAAVGQALASQGANGRPSIEEVVEAVARQGVGSEQLARKISLFLCHRLTGSPLKQIGERFGLKESAVAQASRRLCGRLVEDQALAAQVAAVGRSLGGRSPASARGKFVPKDEDRKGKGGEAAKGLVDEILKVLEDFPEVRFCTLYGSAGQGRMTAQSDVDIAVAAVEPLPVDVRVRLSLALSAAVGREVDLVDLQELSGLILEQALCKAVVVKNVDHPLYARLLKRLWYNQADMMPYVRRVLEQRSNHWLR